MHDFYQIGLCRHNCVDRLVSRWRFRHYVSLLTAFHALGHPDMVLHREALLRFVARHRTTRAVAAAMEALRVALPANDVRSCTHAARDNSHISLARTNATLTRDQNVLAEVRLACHIVVVAVDAL